MKSAESFEKEGLCCKQITAVTYARWELAAAAQR